MFFGRKKRGPREDNRRRGRPAASDKDRGLKPCGRDFSDGGVQVSLLLPTSRLGEASDLGAGYLREMGLTDSRVVAAERAGMGLTHVVGRGCFSQVPESVEPAQMSTVLPHEMARDIAKQLGRKLVIVGGCWGPEAYRVVSDPLFTIKGYLGDPGLEAYAEFDAFQLKATENLDELVRSCCEKKADVVIVSRVASSHDVVLEDLKKFVAALNKAGGTQHKFIKIAVSPRLTNEEAHAIGFEAGFGTGTVPSQLIGVIDR